VTGSLRRLLALAGRYGSKHLPDGSRRAKRGVIVQKQAFHRGDHLFVMALSSIEEKTFFLRQRGDVR
jgi:hypothetical protein